MDFTEENKSIRNDNAESENEFVIILTKIWRKILDMNHRDRFLLQILI